MTVRDLLSPLPDPAALRPRRRAIALLDAVSAQARTLGLPVEES